MHPGVPSFSLLVDCVPLNFAAEEGDFQFWRNSKDHTLPSLLFVDRLQLNYVEG